MGLTSLDGLDDFVRVNTRNHERYASRLVEVPGVRLREAAAASEQHNHQYVVAELDDELLRALPRDDLVAALHAENVLARRYFHPGCHRLEPYRDPGIRLPVTEDVAARVLVLPTGTSVDAADVDTICALIDTCVRRPAAVRERLRTLRAPGDDHARI